MRKLAITLWMLLICLALFIGASQVREAWRYSHPGAVYLFVLWALFIFGPMRFELMNEIRYK